MKIWFLPIQTNKQNTSIFRSNLYKLVFNIREVIGFVNALNRLFAVNLDLSPFVYLDPHVLLDYISMCVPNCNASSFFDNIELAISCDELRATIFITYDALS